MSYGHHVTVENKLDLSVLVPYLATRLVRKLVLYGIHTCNPFSYQGVPLLVLVRVGTVPSEQA